MGDPRPEACDDALRIDRGRADETNDSGGRSVLNGPRHGSNQFDCGNSAQMRLDLFQFDAIA